MDSESIFGRLTELVGDLRDRREAGDAWRLVVPGGSCDDRDRVSHSGNTTAPIESTNHGGSVVAGTLRRVPCLTLLDAVGEEARRGETIRFHSSGTTTFGRASTDPLAATLERRRPGSVERTGSLAAPVLSREQAQIETGDDELLVTNIGQLKMRVNGERVSRARLQPGDVLEFERCCAFVFTMAPAEMPAMRAPYPPFPFGEADAFGIAGESAAIWAVRAQLAALAQLETPVLILGETGTGKFPAASALHGLSRRQVGPFITFNAGTFTDELVALIMFGNRKDYPNPGTPETPGLVRGADGGSLFLDEIGEITKRMQAALLVAFDPAGLFTVFGEQKPRRANARFICATNRDPSELKNDFAARFTAVVEMPPLAARREDIPLIARQLVIAESERDGGDVARRFLRPGAKRDEVSLDPALLAKLVQLECPANIRSIERFLKRAMIDSPDGTLHVTAEIEAAPTAVRVATITEATIRAALERHDGNVSAAARELGIGRDTLRRLLGSKK